MLAKGGKTMNYNEASRESFIQIIEEKDKRIQELSIMKAKLQYQAYMDCVTGVGLLSITQIIGCQLVN